MEGCLWAFAQGVNLRLQFSFLSFVEDNTTYQKQSAVQRVVTPVMTDHILLSFPQQSRDEDIEQPGYMQPRELFPTAGSNPRILCTWGSLYPGVTSICRELALPWWVLGA